VKMKKNVRIWNMKVEGVYELERLKVKNQ
jgi:hypothetical protein